jgi:Ca-activated chloride channel family protein
MASFTPTLPHAASSPIALKVLVDCSGSMAGDSIQAARQALHRVLGGLEANDRFSLSRFGSHVEHRCKALWKVLPRTQAAARLWVEQLDADLGGTEMATALASTLALSGGGRADTRANTQPNAQLNARPDARADVLLVTDGEVEAIDEVIGTAQASGQRMFVVGIGSSAAETLLRRLAEETGGSCEFVAPGEEVEPAILRLYHRMRSSVVTQVSITWPEGLEPMAQTEIPKAIFHGDSINVYARLKAGRADALCQPIALLGSGMGVGLDEGVVRPLAEVRPAFIADEANTLARLAAHTRYTQLRRSADAAPAFLTKALPGLAEKYQLVTDDTSFVLVKERDAAEQPADLPALRQVPHMLAAGWGGQGSVVASKSMSVPSVWRSQRTTASAVHYLRRSMLDDFEIPAFLRRSADVDDMDGDMSFDAPATIKEPQRSTSNWVDTATGASRSGVSCPGWTPAGYAQWLRMNPGQWPETYAALRTMGLGEWVVQWLEFVIADIADMDGVDTQVGLPVPGENEQTVVLAFNQVMADRGRSFLSELGDKFASVIGKDQKTLVDSPLPELDGLRGRIQAALLGMVPGAWPDAVLHFGEDVDA